MEWLRCNKCYRLMNSSKNRFILTQCGHIFCEPCLSRATTKCRECGTIEFKTLPLEKPPTLETVINYFSPVTDFIQLSQKAIQFHEEQLAISFRGFKQAITKYNSLKVLYCKMTENMKILSIQFKKLQAERANIDRQIKIRLDHLRAKIRRSSDEEKKMKKDFLPEQRTSQRHGNSRESQIKSLQNAPEKFVMYPARSQVQRRPSSSDHQKRTSPSTPEYHRSNQNPAFSKNSWTSTNSSTDSGTGTAIISPNTAFSNNSWTTPNSSIDYGNGIVKTSPSPTFSNNNWTPANSSMDCETEIMIATPIRRQENFVVPSIQKVPKSMASWRKDKQTLQRVQERYKSRKS